MMHTAGIGIIVAYITCIHTNKTRFSQIKLPTFEHFICKDGRDGEDD